MAGPPITRYERARTVIGRLLLWGVILLLVGYAIAVFNWPGEEIETFSDDVTQTGSQGAVALGFLVAGVGQLMAFVGLIGWGVRLGMEAVSPSTD